ncbi:IS200/IS605 family element transposase accessory protein TnpB [Candidatus Dependentiae bacterium]|nr:IS200/IS605 family element transposase accessory protein TnpB [Tatlockia sp.]MBA3954981.1 IS200/IS605 family element transposase accessory protein TnpB [Candidatus Dependentiae bacterium]
MKHFCRRLKKKEKPGFPKFKKRGQKDSFRYPQGIKINGNAVFLPKTGWINFTNTRPIEGTIKQATIKRDGSHWLIHIACAVPVEIVYAPVSEDKAIGIDLGLLSFAHMSDGTVIDNPRCLKHELKQLRYLQRSCARKQKDSSNRKKSIVKIAQLHRKIRNKRKDFLYKVSTVVVKNHGVIAVEDLHVKGMIKNRHLSRSIADVGWSSFLQYLEYKCHWQGKHFVRVNRFLPSSKMCSSCSIQKDMPLKLRTYTCSSCSLIIDRDLNASKNIRSAGISALKTCRANSIGLRNEAGITGF